MASAIHVLIFDGYADWEPAFALAEARRSGGHEVLAVGLTKDPVTSMGGLLVVPHIPLGEVDPDRVRLFILPGGDMWEDETAYPRADLEALLRALAEKGVPVAAICGATLALARAGLLDGRAHTSNGRDYIAQFAPDYAGAERYVDELATRDRCVVTASGLGAIEFAREIFAELEVMTPEDRAQWFRVFKTGVWESPAGA